MAELGELGVDREGATRGDGNTDNGDGGEAVGRVDEVVCVSGTGWWSGMNRREVALLRRVGLLAFAWRRA